MLHQLVNPTTEDGFRLQLSNRIAEDLDNILNFLNNYLR
jgi:hypothetical protein